MPKDEDSKEIAELYFRQQQEKQNQYVGKMKVLTQLASFGQELCQSTTCRSDKCDSWIRNEVETILMLNGAHPFGKVGEKVEFNPAVHQYKRDSKMISNQGKIICKGYNIKTPFDEEVVLLRALIEPTEK